MALSLVVARVGCVWGAVPMRSTRALSAGTMFAQRQVGPIMGEKFDDDPAFWPRF